MTKGQKGKLRPPRKSLAAEIKETDRLIREMKENIRKGRVNRYEKFPQLAQRRGELQ